MRRSILSILPLACALVAQRGFAASCQRSAVSVQLLLEPGQHAFQFSDARCELVVVRWLDQFQISGQQQMVFELAGGSPRDGAKTGELGVAATSTPLSEVGRD